MRPTLAPTLQPTGHPTLVPTLSVVPTHAPSPFPSLPPTAVEPSNLITIGPVQVGSADRAILLVAVVVFGALGVIVVVLAVRECCKQLARDEMNAELELAAAGRNGGRAAAAAAKAAKAKAKLGGGAVSPLGHPGDGSRAHAPPSPPPHRRDPREVIAEKRAYLASLGLRSDSRGRPLPDKPLPDPRAPPPLRGPSAGRRGDGEGGGEPAPKGIAYAKAIASQRQSRPAQPPPPPSFAPPPRRLVEGVGSAGAGGPGPGGGGGGGGGGGDSGGGLGAFDRMSLFAAGREPGARPPAPAAEETKAEPDAPILGVLSLGSLI